MIKKMLLGLVVFNVSIASSIHQDFNESKAFVQALGNQAATSVAQFDFNSLPQSHDSGEYLYQAAQNKAIDLKTLGQEESLKRESEGAIIHQGKDGYIQDIKDVLTEAKQEIGQSQGVEDHLESYLDKGQVYCQDGSCSQGKVLNTLDFEGDVSKLLAVGASAKALNQTKDLKGLTRVFGGEAYTCEISSLHFLDCCDEKGWGKQLNLAQCSTQDKQLGLAKLEYKVHYVGKYCSKRKKYPGGSMCTQHANTYCVFPTKIARIIREQAPYTQSLIYKSFGSAKHPDCSGFLPHELTYFNLNWVNFKNPIYPFNPLNPFGEASDNLAGISIDVQQKQFSLKELASKARNASQKGGQ